MDGNGGPLLLLLLLDFACSGVSQEEERGVRRIEEDVAGERQEAGDVGAANEGCTRGGLMTWRAARGGSYVASPGDPSRRSR